MIIAVADAAREFDLCTGLARLDELRLALLGGCSKAGSECNTISSQLLRWRHECRCTGEQRDCGEDTHVAARRKHRIQQWPMSCGRLSWLQPALVCHYTSPGPIFEDAKVQQQRIGLLHNHFIIQTIIHESEEETSARTLSTMAVRCHASRFTRNAGASPGATQDTCVRLQEAPRGSIR